MATTPTKPALDRASEPSGSRMPSWPAGQPTSRAASISGVLADDPQTTHRDALQALLAFSALHEQVRKRTALAARPAEFETSARSREFDQQEQFVLDDVLQLVAERAIAITGADGLAIALAENNEIVLRASAGTIRPDVGTRIDRTSAFSGACFRSAQVIRCDDSELDPRVNLRTCRKLGARSMVAVPLCGRKRVIGVLEAFSAEPFGFNDSDLRNLTLLAELILGALKPEDEDRFADSAQAAVSELDAQPITQPSAPPARVEPPPRERVPSQGLVPGVAAGQKSDSAVMPTASVPAKTPETAEAKRHALEAPELPITAAANVSTAVEPAPRSGSKTLLLLAAVVVVVLLALGIWWKWKTAQLGQSMVTSQPAATEPSAPAANNAVNPAEKVAIPAPTPSASPAITSPGDTLSDTGTPSDTPATAQELSRFPRVTSIRHWSSADSSTVVLDLEDQVQYEAHRLSKPDRIYFDLRDTTLAADLAGKTIEVGDSLISRIRVAQPVAGMTRVVLETKGNSNFSVSLEPNPYRLLVQIRKIGADSKGGALNLSPGITEQKNPLAIVVAPPTKEDFQLRAHVPKLRIVVDAGHGGWDLGTVGRRGLLEKDLCLEIAQRLGKLLESRIGAEVLYTRQDDIYIPLDERAAMANQAQADLFISVHANYSDLPSARGVETYYTTSFSTPNSKDSDTHNPNASPTAPVLSPVELHGRIEQSRHLAASVQRALYGMLSVQNPGLRDRGVKEAGFVVLTETAMPGILAEVSFVSSPTDEQKLRSDGYRERIAEALYKGIARYAASAHPVKVASASK